MTEITTLDANNANEVKNLGLGLFKTWTDVSFSGGRKLQMRLEQRQRDMKVYLDFVDGVGTRVMQYRAKIERCREELAETINLIDPTAKMSAEKLMQSLSSNLRDPKYLQPDLETLHDLNDLHTNLISKLTNATVMAQKDAEAVKFLNHIQKGAAMCLLGSVAVVLGAPVLALQVGALEIDSAGATVDAMKDWIRSVGQTSNTTKLQNNLEIMEKLFLSADQGHKQAACHLAMMSQIAQRTSNDLTTSKRRIADAIDVAMVNGDEDGRRKIQFWLQDFRGTDGGLRDSLKNLDNIHSQIYEHMSNIADMLRSLSTTPPAKSSRFSRFCAKLA